MLRGHVLWNKRTLVAQLSKCRISTYGKIKYTALKSTWRNPVVYLEGTLYSSISPPLKWNFPPLKWEGYYAYFSIQRGKLLL
jgi:hypothetical protein